MTRIPAQLRDRATFEGHPVPHVQLWTGELPETAWSWRDDPIIGRPGWFTPGEPGTGEPVLDRYHPARQRRSMIEVACSYCDATIDRGDGWLILAADADEEPVTIDGRAGTALVVRDPWLCRPCAGYVAAVTLAHGAAAAELVLFHRPLQWIPIMETGYPPNHPLAAAAETVQPTSTVKLAIGDGLTLAPDDFPQLHVP